MGSSSTSRLTDRAWKIAIRARVRSPIERLRAGRSTCSAPSPNFASSVRTSRPARVAELPLDHVDDRVVGLEERALLVDDTDPHPCPEAVPAGGQGQRAEQRAEERGLAAAVVPGQRDPVAAGDGQVDRPQPEAAARHLGTGQGGHHVGRR